MQSEKDEQAENAQDQDKAMDLSEKPVIPVLTKFLAYNSLTDECSSVTQAYNIYNKCTRSYTIRGTHEYDLCSFAKTLISLRSDLVLNHVVTEPKCRTTQQEDYGRQLAKNKLHAVRSGRMWVCLCAWWLARSSTSWSPERLRGLTSALHVCAWGFPALQTVIALVYRDVDSDELTGTCYIGNKNLFTLWYLALVPHFLYFCAGGLLLTIGWIFVLKAPKLPRNSLSTPLTQGQPRTERDFLGALATLYVVPIFVVMMSYFIEYSDREKWLSGDQKPSMWFFLLLRHFMSLFMGISSVLWIWCEKSAQVWKSALKRLGPRFKPNKNTIALKKYLKIVSIPFHIILGLSVCRAVHTVVQDKVVTLIRAESLLEVTTYAMEMKRSFKLV
ncbi:hypothetical protein HUJ05_010530 [Dendroctonus ponderosae]|nr:hypothetical protein HUJ05_010530 [Dendroctonus ponderosae]